MQISLTNYTTQLPKDLLKKAERCTVRECDETEKGKFEAYVDEGKETCDVAVTIAANKEIAAHSCDCKGPGKTVCRHVAALLMNIGKGSKPKTGKLAKNKLSKAEAVLDAADGAELKEWVRELLAKNKDLELAFTQRFAAKKTAYSAEEVKSLTAEAIKSVVKNRSNIDPSELKKIIDLWAGIHKPVVEYYLANVTDENGFLAFHALLESCQAFEAKISGGGNKILKYKEGVLNQTVETVNNLFDEATWQTATGYFIKWLPDGLHSIRLHYLNHLKNITATGSTERSRQLTKTLMDQYRRSFTDHLVNGAAYTKTLFSLVQQQGLLTQYLSFFKPIRFDNEFNLPLITQLIETGNLALAEGYCLAQIQGNYKEAYDIPYLELLKKVYRLQNNEAGLADVTGQLLPFTFDFDDYLFLYERMPEGEAKKKWRTKLITRARQSSNYHNSRATAFYFTLLDYEKGHKKMIDSINSYTPYGVILQYFERMAVTDKARLLKAIFDKSDDSMWGVAYEEREKDRECFPELLVQMKKYYDAGHLLLALRSLQSNRFYYRANKFLEYMKKELVLEG